jgi:hypothetical protein
MAARGIDSLPILERDNWTCQLCGVETPRSLLGTTDPRAPELGHIVPVVAGGSHEAQNLRCECRGCNHFKGSLTDRELLAALMRRVSEEKLTTRPLRHVRMSDAIRAAQARGLKWGRPRCSLTPEEVVACVDANNGSVTKAAKQLGISYGLAYTLNHRARPDLFINVWEVPRV